MIQLTVMEVLAEDSRFYHNMILVKERGSNRARKGVARTLQSLILRKADYTMPNPVEMVTPEMGLDELAELFSSAVYEKIKKDAFIDLQPERGVGRDFGIEIAPDRRANPRLHDCYESFFKLLMHAESMPGKDRRNRAEYEMASRAAENAVKELEEMEKELAEMKANLARKKSYGSKSKPTNGLESEIMKMSGNVASKRNNVGDLSARESSLMLKIESDALHGKAYYNHLLLEVATCAGDAGLAELASAARSIVDGDSALSESLDEALNERFDKSVTQNVICSIDFPKYAPRIWPRWLTIGGPVAGVAAAWLIAALILGGGDAEKDEKPKGRTSSPVLNAMYEQGIPPAPSSRDITAVDNPDDLNRAIRDRYGRRGGEQEIQGEGGWQSSGMERDGTKWKPVMDPHEAKKRKRDNTLELAVTEGKGVEVFRYGNGAKYDIDLGNWWAGIKHEPNESPERIIMYCQKEGSTNKDPATVLEMIVDEEKKRVTPIIPESMEEGLYLLVLDIEDATGHNTKANYAMCIRRQDGDTYMGVRFIDGNLPITIPPPEKTLAKAWGVSSEKEAGPHVTLNDRNDIGGTVEFFYIHEEIGRRTWKPVNHEKVDKGGGQKNLNPIFPPGTRAGEYVVKSRTEYEDGSLKDEFFKAIVDKKGRASLVSRIVPEPGNSLEKYLTQSLEAELPKPHPIEEIYKDFVFGEPRLEYRQGSSGQWNPLTVIKDPITGRRAMSFGANVDWDITIRATAAPDRESKLYRASVKSGEIAGVSEMVTSSPAGHHP